MKLDMDLARSILLKLESHGHFDSVVSDEIEVDGHVPDAVQYHIHLLADAGLITTSRDSPGDDGFVVFRMTWEGHQFLEKSRDSKIWKQAKAAAGKSGGMAYDLLLAVLTRLINQQFN